MNDRELIRRLKHGDEQTLAQLLQQYGRLVWTVAAGILAGVGTAQDTEELVSDVFVELWRRPDGFDAHRGTLKTYLCVKARSRAIDALRRLRRTDTLALEELPEPETQLPDSGGVLPRVAQLLAQYAPPDREILTLRLLYELKPADIAAKLSLPPEQVYERIRRGKTRLAAQLRQEGYDE